MNKYIYAHVNRANPNDTWLQNTINLFIQHDHSLLLCWLMPQLEYLHFFAFYLEISRGTSGIWWSGLRVFRRMSSAT